MRICIGLLFDVYDTYRLWWVPRDFIAFARTSCIDMFVVLVSESNVAEFLEVLGVIESTRFDQILRECRDRTTHIENRPIDYHPGRRSQTRDFGADFVYYDPWRLAKVSKRISLQRSATVRQVLD